MIKNEYISIIIPVYNEELSIKFVLVELICVLKRTFKKYEIIVINDGSTDKTGFIVEKLKQDNLKNLKIVNLKKRVGQSLALQIGINKAKGDILFFFDGDGQYDPRDLFKVYCFLVNNDFDFVSGIRINRKDTFIRLLISKMVFFFRKIFFNDHFIDSGCGLKAFKKKCYKLYKLQDGDHRFINIILTKQGFTGGQINIKHRSRYAGKSKYNLLNRLISIYHFILLFFRYR